MNNKRLFNVYNPQEEDILHEAVNKHYVRNIAFDLIEDRAGLDDSLGFKLRAVVKKGFDKFTFQDAVKTLKNWGFRLDLVE